MAAADLNTIRSTIEGRLATELANSPALPAKEEEEAAASSEGRHRSARTLCVCVGLISLCRVSLIVPIRLFLSLISRERK